MRKTAEGKFQAGFGEPLSSVTKPGKAKSLADVIADTSQAPWRGAFDLGEGVFWYVAVSDGYELLPEGDRLCTAVELAALQAEQASYFDWREVKGTYADLAELAGATNGKDGLRDFAPQMGDIFKINRKTALILGAMAVLTVSGLAAAAYFHSQRVAEEAATAADNAKKAQAKADQEALASRPPPPPWTLVPTSVELFAACKDAWANQSVAKPGWALATWTCARSPSGLDVTEEWASDEGRAKDAPGLMQADGKKSTVTRAIPVQWFVEAQQAGQSGHEVVELLSPDAAQRAARDLAQRFGADLVLVQPDAPKVVPGADAQPLPTYIEMTSTPSLPMAPWFGFGPAFDALPGHRASAITLDLTKDIWSIKCQLFAARSPVKGTI